MSRHPHGDGDASRSPVATVTLPPSAVPASPRSPLTSGPPPAGPCRPGTARRPASGRRRAAGARWPAPPRPARVRDRAAAGWTGTRRPGCPASRPSPCPVRGGRRRRRAGPRCTSISSAIRPSTCRSDSTPGTPKRGLERARPALPVHERAGLLRHRRHRQHHVGAVGDRAGPQLQADHERRGLERVERGLRVGQVGRVHPGDDQGVQVARQRRGEDLPAVPARLGGQRGHAPGPGHLGPRRAGRPPGGRAGSRSGRAPASIAPRSPARRGTQASLAPVALASRATAVSAPGTSASRSPARMTAPSAASARPAAARPSGIGAHLGRPAGSTARPRRRARCGSSVPRIFASPRLANGASE